MDDLYQREEIADVIQPQKKRFGLALVIVGALFMCALVVCITLYAVTRAPENFVPTSVTILPGSTIAEIVDEVTDQGVVRSSTLLYMTLLSIHRNEPIKAGTYEFEYPVSVFGVAHMLTRTIPQDELVSLTLPEGMRAKEYAHMAHAVLINFDTEEFLHLASSSEGLLWPETYFVPPTFTAQKLYDLLRQSHDEIWQEFADEVERSNLTPIEIVTLASLVEREANDEASMKMVAGILLNRLDIGMPLQADASIEYVLDVPLNELPPGELAVYLEELDSPYNTYLYRGLPPTPIGNPGRDAIEAVLVPTESPYLFYITGNDGVFYYAETFAEHQANVEAHLR